MMHFFRPAPHRCPQDCLVDPAAPHKYHFLCVLVAGVPSRGQRLGSGCPCGAGHAVRAQEMEMSVFASGGLDEHGRLSFSK